MDCPLCDAKSEKRRLVSENENAFCIVNFEPLNEGHVMVLPKNHVENLGDLSAEEGFDLIELIQDAKKKIRKNFDEDPIVFQNTGKHSTQRHVHLHVLPSKGALREMMSKYEGVPERKRRSEEELESIKDRLV